MRTSKGTVAAFRHAEATPDAAAAHVTTLVSLTGDGTPAVYLDAAAPAVPARLAVAITRERLEAAVAERQQVVVVFEHGDRSKPLIIGLVESLNPQPSDPEARPDANERVPVIDADVDGRRVRLTAHDEIVLQCGAASVTLRRNGRVVIRGTYIETQSEGTNRIKGGQVQIN